MAASRSVVSDTSVALPSCLAGGLRFSGQWRWLAPALLWSEVLSALHEATWRGELTREEADAAWAVFAGLPVYREDVCELADEAWRIADEFGLAKTYDPELGFVVDPVELEKLAK